MFANSIERRKRAKAIQSPVSVFGLCTHNISTWGVVELLKIEHVAFSHIILNNLSMPQVLVEHEDPWFSITCDMFAITPLQLSSTIYFLSLTNLLSPISQWLYHTMHHTYTHNTLHDHTLACCFAHNVSFT